MSKKQLQNNIDLNMPTLRCIIVIAGDATVGKTTLVHQLTETMASKTYQMTTGVDYKVKTVPIPDTHYKVEFHIVDLGGNPIYKDFASQMCQKANFAMYVYDVTSKSSFDGLRSWVATVAEQNSDKSVPAVLVANKSDLEDRAAVRKEEGRAFAESLGAEFFSVSSLKGGEADLPFKYIAQTFYDKFQSRISHLDTIVSSS